MRDVAMVRIWNTSKSPAQSAWVDWNNSTTQLKVQNAADIITWANGETIRLGDPNPTGTNVLEMVAIDISNYLYNNLGAVFRQKAVNLGVYVSGNGPNGLAFSGTGATGSAFNGNALDSGAGNGMTQIVPATVLSPVSDSNLVFLKEVLGGAGTSFSVTFARILGVFV